MPQSKQDTVQIPLALLRTLLVELDSCADFLHLHRHQQEESLPSDWFRCLILIPQAQDTGGQTGESDVELYSDDVRKLIERCLSAVRGMVIQYRKTVQVGVDALRMLEVERGRLYELACVDVDVDVRMLEIDKWNGGGHGKRAGTGIEELETDIEIGIEISSAKAHGDVDVDGYDFDADHGY